MSRSPRVGRYSVVDVDERRNAPASSNNCSDVTPLTSSTVDTSSMSRPSAEQTSLLGASSPEGSQGSATSRATHESSDVTSHVGFDSLDVTRDTDVSSATPSRPLLASRLNNLNLASHLPNGSPRRHARARYFADPPRVDQSPRTLSSSANSMTSSCNYNTSEENHERVTTDDVSREFKHKKRKASKCWKGKEHLCCLFGSVAFLLGAIFFCIGLILFLNSQTLSTSLPCAAEVIGVAIDSTTSAHALATQPTIGDVTPAQTTSPSTTTTTVNYGKLFIFWFEEKMLKNREKMLP